LVLLAVSVSLAVAEYVHFHGHSVVRVNLENAEQVKMVEEMNLDVWSRDCQLVVGLNDVMVNTTQKQALIARGISGEVMIADVEQVISAEREYHANFKQSDAPLAWYDAYHTYTEIVEYVKGFATTYPHLATFVPSVGTSIQGRAIPAIHITNGSGTNKKKIWFNGGQHAREWIGPATVIYITEQLLSKFATDDTVNKLLTGIEFVIVPLSNPDGYDYTWTTNRLWRKNRRANTGGTYGVDLNRNWNDHWGGEGSSGTPSSDTYRGTAPFSEPESLAISNYITKTGPFAGAIDYHSYSQLVLRPYGWSNQPPSNEATAKLVGDNISAAIRNNSGKAYTSEPSWQLYYTSGSAQDWFFTPAKIPLSYTIELRDTGTYGFQLPANQIVPTGSENWDAFRYFANYILTH
jgi:carboxypeptidase A2